MQQTQPLFLIRKYRSILRATVIVEAVDFIVSLTDSVVAGNRLGSDALAAIGLIAPFLSFSIFLSAVVSSGTLTYYSYSVGSFEKRRAQEFFSQGFFTALILGFLYAAGLFLFRGPILSLIAGPGAVREYAREYFTVILLTFFMNPVTYLLDNMVVADGGEKLSAAANVTTIVCNVVCSLLFVVPWGVRGVAAASVLADVLFLLILSSHFVKKANTIRLVPRWSWRDLAAVLRGGIVHASNYALEGLTFFGINLFALYQFDSETLVLLVIAEKFLGLLTLFIGLAASPQTLIGTLTGEKNAKALRALMRRVCTDMLSAGALLTILTLLFAPLLVRAFGANADPLLSDGVIALRIVGSTLVLHALLSLFFIYYDLIGRPWLAFILCAVRSFISPVLLSVVLAALTHSRYGMWIGLAAAPVLSTLVCALIISLRTPRDQFPFMLPRDPDSETYIYDFEVTPENAADMSRTAGEVLRANGFSERTQTLAGVFVEDILMLVREKNGGKKKLFAECTILAEKDGVRLILRDSGVIFDVTDADARASSFRQYLVANLMVRQQLKAYLTTTGYNRNELFFPEKREQA